MRHARCIHFAAALTVLALTGATAPGAFAQTSPPVTEAPRWFVSLGAARMDPLHGDDYPEGGVLLGSIGVAASSHVRIEAEVTRRSHSTLYVDHDVFLYGGPNGIHGRIDRTESGRETTDWTAGVNLIGRTGWRAVSLFGGAGVMLNRERLRQYRTVTGCTLPIPSSGGECMTHDSQSTTLGAGLQLMTGVDVALHRRVSAFVAARGELRQGLAMGSAGVMAGITVAVR